MAQDPDPVSSNHARKASTGESKKLSRNPFARTKSRTKMTKMTKTTADPAATTHSNPFATATIANDDVTLVNHNIPNDPDAEFHHAEEKWKFKLKNRKASAPATEVGEYPRATSGDDRSNFAELMEKTQGMTPEQVAAFLRARDRVDGEKIMNGRKGSGYLMMAGAFMGTM